MVVEETHRIAQTKSSQSGWRIYCICGWKSIWTRTRDFALEDFNAHLASVSTPEATGHLGAIAAEHDFTTHDFTWRAGAGWCVCGWTSGRSNPSAAWQQFGAHLGVPGDPPVDREPVEEPKELDPNEPGAVPALMLALELQARSHAESAATTSALLASKDKRLAELEATLRVIQTSVPALFDGGVMPTENAILRLIRCPSPVTIAAEIEKIRARQEGNS